METTYEFAMRVQPVYELLRLTWNNRPNGPRYIPTIEDIDCALQSLIQHSVKYNDKVASGRLFAQYAEGVAVFGFELWAD